MRSIAVALLFATLAVSGFAMSFSSHRTTVQPQVSAAAPIPICPYTGCPIQNPPR